MKFRKKPVVVDAWPARELWDAAAKDWESLPGDVRSAYEEGRILFQETGVVDLYALAGWQRAEPDHWIVREAGELYPCDPDTFQATYEPAEGE